MHKPGNLSASWKRRCSAPERRSGIRRREWCAALCPVARCTGALDVLVVGSLLKAGKAGGSATATEAEPAAANMARMERLVGVEGRLALEEAEALAARLSEAEAVEMGPRCPVGLKELERYRPAVSSEIASARRWSSNDAWGKP